MAAEQKPTGKSDREEPSSLSGMFLAVLSERERRFVLEVAVNEEYNKTRAMTKAGYSRSTAYKKQFAVYKRSRVQQALLAFEFELKGSDWLSNDELRLIGLNPRSVRQIERRELEARSKAESKFHVAQVLGRIRRIR